MEVGDDQLRQAVQGKHGGKAVLIQVAIINEEFQGKTVWEGVVHVFNWYGHPKATRAYAWSSPTKGTEPRRFHAVLNLNGIRSPLDAVRSAMPSERNGGSGLRRSDWSLIALKPISQS